MRPTIISIDAIDGGIALDISGFGPWGIRANQLDNLDHGDFPIWEAWCDTTWTTAARAAIAKATGGAA